MQKCIVSCVRQSNNNFINCERTLLSRKKETVTAVELISSSYEATIGQHAGGEKRMGVIIDLVSCESVKLHGQVTLNL